MVFFVHLECGMQGVVVCYGMVETSDVPPTTARRRTENGSTTTGNRLDSSQVNNAKQGNRRTSRRADFEILNEKLKGTRTNTPSVRRTVRCLLLVLHVFCGIMRGHR